MNIVDYWICEIALISSGFIYVHTIEHREASKKRLIAGAVIFLLLSGAAKAICGDRASWMGILFRLIRFMLLICLLHGNRRMKWNDSIYYAVWAFMSWQLLTEISIFFSLNVEAAKNDILRWGVEIGCFLLGQSIIGMTIGIWIPDEGRKKIGPRQLASALLTFLIFELIVIIPLTLRLPSRHMGWVAMYITQVLMGVILYLENEVFKKVEIIKELDMVNLLWKKEQEQYQLSKETITLINQKCHDLKHQIRQVRMMAQSGNTEISQYLDEMEESVKIYDALVKTGNEVLDTILTEKSLYCREKDITVSCVADGSQLGFIHTVDLYAIMGNILDNAIEAVEKFSIGEMRQIDVMIYRKDHFLAINVINPCKIKLTYEEGLPVTTKGDRKYHGFGLKSVKYLLKRYDGVLTICEEKGMFSLMILIPIP